MNCRRCGAELPPEFPICGSCGYDVTSSGPVEDFDEDATAAEHFGGNSGVTDEAASLPYILGDVLKDRYRLEDLLGYGPLGAVFRGVDLDLDTEIAVKVVSPAYLTDAGLRGNFVRQMESARALSHPAVLELHEVAEDGEWCYCVYEFSSGQSLGGVLAERLALGDVSPAMESRLIVLGAADVLSAAHPEFVYGSLKPANVSLLPAAVKLCDFGLGAAVPPDAYVAGHRDRSHPLRYLAPEVLDGFTPAPEADVYALGVLAFELLTGFMFTPEPEAIEAVDRLSPDCRRVLVAATARDPARRPRALGELVEPLVEYLDLAGLALPEAGGQSGPWEATTKPVPRSQPAKEGTVQLHMDDLEVIDGSGPSASPADDLLDDDVDEPTFEIKPFSSLQMLEEKERAGPARPVLEPEPIPGTLPSPAASAPARLPAPGGAGRAAGGPAPPARRRKPRKPPADPAAMADRPIEASGEVGVVARQPVARAPEPAVTVEPMPASSATAKLAALQSPMVPLPVAPTPPADGRRRTILVIAIVSVVAVLIGAVVLILLARQGDGPGLGKPGSTPPVASGDPDGGTAGPKVVSVPGGRDASTATPPRGTGPCPAGMIRIKHGRRRRLLHFCIDRYEYPNRKGVVPRSVADPDEARRLCRAQGKRLCQRKEWERACSGHKGRRFPYGRRFRQGLCAVARGSGSKLDKQPVAPSGSHRRCRSSYGVHDLSGNLAEWVASGQLMGGSAGKAGNLSSCRSDAGSGGIRYIGLRCCADVRKK